uniref:Uncharacterized protein n=1 Tax=Cucumis melo TaxID=3656 RepID=A0A9I9CKF6_CUCME
MSHDGRHAADARDDRVRYLARVHGREGHRRAQMLLEYLMMDKKARDDSRRLANTRDGLFKIFNDS